MTSRICFCFLLLLPALVGSACSQVTGNEATQKTILVKGFFDRSGPTSDVGLPYSQAILDFIAEVNRKGGIKKHKIVIEWEDFQNDPDKALQIYETWKTQKNWTSVVTIFGWNTKDSVLLNQKVASDLVPYISASYAGTLGSPKDIQKDVLLPDKSTHKVDTKGAPYNFYVGTDSSTSIRLALKFVESSKADKVAFFYCNTDDCTSPIPAGKTYADTLKLPIGPDLQVPLSADAAKIDSLVKDYFAKNPVKTDERLWIWIGNTTNTASMIARAVAQYAPSARLVVNVWGFDETMYARCQDPQKTTNPCAGRVFGLMPFAAYGDLSYKGMKDLVVMQNKQRELAGEDKTTFRNVRYVQGYVSFLIWKAALEQILDQNREASGYNIKAELERFRAFSTAGLTLPISFSANDHRPTNGALIYSFNEAGGLDFQSQVELEQKPEWLGW